MSKLIDEIYRVQAECKEISDRDRLLLKMFANILEVEHGVRKPQNRLVADEYFELPGRWELLEGMLHWDGAPYSDL